VKSHDLEPEAISLRHEYDLYELVLKGEETFWSRCQLNEHGERTNIRRIMPKRVTWIDINKNAKRRKGIDE
jgi:hypothetical protein